MKNNIDMMFKNQFENAEREAKKGFNSLDVYNTPCTYYGEIDCHEDCIALGIPKEQVYDYYKNFRKPNVFKFENGEWLLCDDFLAEAIFENGKWKDNSYTVDFDEDSQEGNIITPESVKTDKIMEELYNSKTIQIKENNKRYMIVCLSVFDPRIEKYNWHIIDVTEEHNMNDYKEKIIDNEIDIFNYFYNKIINNCAEIEILN